MTYGHALAQEPLPRDEIYNFSRPFLGHHYCILSITMSDLCPREEKKIFKEIMNFH